MSKKTKIVLEISEELYHTSKDKLDMSIDDFLEYSLSMYVYNDDEYSALFKKACKHYKELKNAKDKMYLLEKKNRMNKDNKKSYDEAMITVSRIHSRLGYIGKNQLRKIANQNNLNHNDLIRYVTRLDGYTVTNFGDLPKIR